MGSLKYFFHSLLIAEVLLLTLNIQVTISQGTSDGERNITAEMIERERAEKRFSNTIFSRSTGNEFIDNSNASSAAQTDAAILRSIVDQTGINVTTSFDANGNPVDPGESFTLKTKIILMLIN
ncbi:uncharacterized protein [Watersipora subatra]|uniref:uncharacterized protein n=1 Tax=Watersipora subatra TaxID=2589382 RepID=UPI00355C11F7